MVECCFAILRSQNLLFNCAEDNSTRLSDSPPSDRWCVCPGNCQTLQSSGHSWDVHFNARPETVRRFAEFQPFPTRHPNFCRGSSGLSCYMLYSRRLEALAFCSASQWTRMHFLAQTAGERPIGMALHSRRHFKQLPGVLHPLQQLVGLIKIKLPQRI